MREQKRGREQRGIARVQSADEENSPQNKDQKPQTRLWARQRGKLIYRTYESKAVYQDSDRRKRAARDLRRKTRTDSLSVDELNRQVAEVPTMKSCGSDIQVGEAGQPV